MLAYESSEEAIHQYMYYNVAKDRCTEAVCDFAYICKHKISALLRG